MRTLAVLISAVAVAMAAENASVEGKWQVHSTIAGTQYESTCSLKQKDAELSGTCTAADGAEKDVTGKVEGKKIAWSYKSEYDGTPITVNHDGNLGADNKITGSVSVPEFGADGDFIAEQAK